MSCAVKEREPVVATGSESRFFIRFLYQHNSIWQGEIQWLDGKKTRRFRSLLELLVLMHEAMNSESQD